MLEGLKLWPMCRAKRIRIQAKASAREKDKGELVVEIREGHVAPLLGALSIV